MTIQEFSDTFDTLLNSYNTQAVFGEATSKTDIVLDEYEKSVFLTQAQDLIVKQYFDRSLNQQGQGFDDSSRRQIDFSSLITVASLSPSETQEGVYDERGVWFDLPSVSGGLPPVLFILNEKLQIRKTRQAALDPLSEPYAQEGAAALNPLVETTYNKSFVVVPINYKEYDRQMSKAFTQPLKKQAWRLFNDSSDGTEVKAEVIPVANATGLETGESLSYTYKIRYIRRPTPIVLANLGGDDLNVDGVNEASECELNPIIHMDILNKAVELALSTRGGRIIPQKQDDRHQQ